MDRGRCRLTVSLRLNGSLSSRRGGDSDAMSSIKAGWSTAGPRTIYFTLVILSQSDNAFAVAITSSHPCLCGRYSPPGTRWIRPYLTGEWVKTNFDWNITTNIRKTPRITDCQ